MAYKMTKRGSLDNEISNEFICDTIEDMNKIDNKYRTLGSIAMVISGDTGFEVYMANNQKEWINLGSAGGNSSGEDSGNSSTPTWVNQDIIINIPEEYSNSDAGYYQSNMQLENHVITGNIAVNKYSSYGGLAIEIDPSISSFLATSDNFYNLDPTQEYYMPIINIEDDPTSDGPTILPVSLDPLSESYLGIYLPLSAISCSFYKLPGSVIQELSYYAIHTLNYIIPRLQPEATYNVQLTSIDLQAGE